MLREDVIEGIIALPPKLFYGTGIPGCILVLNRNKPESRNGKVIFIYAAKDYEEGKVRNKLRDSDIQKIGSAFKDYKDIEGYCHIADFGELEQNHFNLNVPRYIDISEQEVDINVQDSLNELKKLNQSKVELENQMFENLKELGFQF